MTTKGGGSGLERGNPEARATRSGG